MTSEVVVEGDMASSDTQRLAVMRPAPEALAKMEALMIRWRIAAQRDCPGGSEYMDPAYFEEFIRLRREREHVRAMAYYRLRKAAEALTSKYGASDFPDYMREDWQALEAAASASPGPLTASQAPRDALKPTPKTTGTQP